MVIGIGLLVCSVFLYLIWRKEGLKSKSITEIVNYSKEKGE